jgi:GNAT superfamily N-acetyltransferase
MTFSGAVGRTSVLRDRKTVHGRPDVTGRKTEADSVSVLVNANALDLNAAPPMTARNFAQFHANNIKIRLRTPNLNITSGPFMNTEISLRVATTNDTALIASMHARSWASAYRGILPDTYLDRDLQAERVAHWDARMKDVAAGTASVFIAEHAGEPVGFICLVEPDETGSVLVDNLHALPGHRGLGTGTVMLDEAARWARSRGARQLYLSVLEQNAAAIGFYESRGWTFAEREADHMAGIDVFSLRYVFALD